MNIDVYLHQKPGSFVDVIELLIGTNPPVWVAAAPVEDATRPGAALITTVDFKAARKTIKKYGLSRVHIGGADL